MLEQIKKENDIKKLKPEQLPELAQEIREFLIEKTSKSGGHLASNLGVVELTIAMHRVFDLPKDKIIWDVGHQSYTHKILTGRQDQFDTLRKYGGMSGFPKRKESNCDAFDTGHSSTSISAGLGYVRARDLQGEDYSVISVIGDGSLTGGMAYEALNNAAQLRTNFIIVLNDNHMSISENVGGMSQYLARLRTADFYTGLKKGVTSTLEKVPVVGEGMIERIRKTKSSIKQLVVPGMFFEDMGITYLGPVPGHNIRALCRVLNEARKIEGPVLLHVLTKKGKGYEPAESAPDKFHGIAPFDIATGEVISGKKKDSYTDIFGKVLCDEAKRNTKIVAITAAMADGTGLARFKRLYPSRFYDVGIAEEHAVTFAAGLAAGGMKPVFAVYSSFLQRAYDQMIHDVCLQNL
ncbi:MAG: 1-deoxy-D-xylulose-5-phosphate synthase, partial [Lachnospiraceae bacterium]